MSQSATETFKNSAKRSSKRRRASSISIRVSDAEREALKHKAGKRSVGAYVRERALGADQEPRRKASSKPSIDYALLAQLLGKLGKSDQVSCLFLLSVAAEADRVELAEKERAALDMACADIRDMRSMLMQALGLRGAERSSDAKAMEDEE
ncbi:plasmid mobilization protein [Thalassobaculum salexigens]|uniref:plasmid mobilization protein n=1 Tax=Thalassobaculum salexigens TaxID=455360 RepID=UPI00048BBA11|nr:hypothetical protein [Thalassobaculum salexigens]